MYCIAVNLACSGAVKFLIAQTIVLLVAGDTCDVDTSGSGGDLIDLHIIGLFPCTNPEDKREIPVDNCDGIDRIPIMRLALEEINERCDLLPGYRLVVDYANSGVSNKSYMLIGNSYGYITLL